MDYCESEIIINIITIQFKIHLPIKNYYSIVLCRNRIPLQSKAWHQKLFINVYVDIFSIIGLFRSSKTLPTIMLSSQAKTNVLKNLKTIKTIDLTFTATTFIEKFLWVTIGILGIIWISYIIPIQISTWDENAIIITKGNFEIEMSIIFFIHTL